MRILVLHQNLFDRLGYERAIDHAVHEVTYAGAREYLDNIPDHIRCEKFAWDPALPVAGQLRPLLAARAPYDRIIARHELLITPAAELRAEFGVPGMSPETARKFRDKVVMKDTLTAAGLRVPRYLSLDSLDPAGDPAAPWQGRTIVKPRDEGGSQGVRLFDSVARAIRFVRDQEARLGAGFRARYELEEYVEGPIWHIDGFLFEGEPVVAQSSRYVGTPLGFENGAPIGSVQIDDPALTAWAVRCVRALGGETLTFHLEAIMTEEGPVFMEVAARCGGGHIVRATELRTGAHLHTLDMASDIEGALATRFIGSARPETSHGFFLFPGHVHGGAEVTVRVADGLLDDPLVLSHRMAAPGTPTPLKHSYRPEHLPLSGVVAGTDPAELEAWIGRLFASTTVRAHRPYTDAYDGAGCALEDHELARRLAEEAGALLLGLRTGTALADPGTLKELGDSRSHAFLTAQLALHRPSDAVLSEEGADDPARLAAGRVWIVDPLDGTREYSEAGRDDWAVHVALWADGRLVAGAVALPAQGVTLSTAEPCPAPAADEHDRPVLGSRSRPPAFLARVAERVGAELAGMGSAGAKTAAVVRGQARAYIHAGGQYEWDSAAPAAVALAAGLHVSRLDGSPLRYNREDPYLPDLLVCRPTDAEVLLAAIRAEHGAAAGMREPR
ncbi:inositol monophosphatase family protein [Streptomyces sp. CSDS2]|uniref:inositol monophosphatase family protein n=1 Tax=Streptomyces sp. CSDS2 TaxID=3055051 RepID=UPI0025B0BF47|nr:inositol monophosphatase family protein [Streptomyces sp. CSDS2]MDN3260523.1 inositol monophosphatase family protein [Streptomyces sp. CSDS2]